MAVEARSAPCSIAAGGCGQASPSDRSSSSMSKRVGNMSGVQSALVRGSEQHSLLPPSEFS